MSADDYDASDDAGAVDAVAAALAAGIPVFVVGIDIGGGGDTLDDMAVAGGRPRDDDVKYYPASATSGLVEALEQVVGSIPTCTFALASLTGIQIYGPWCDDVTGGRIPVVEAIFGCAGQVIPIF